MKKSPVDKLRELGHEVHAFSEYHYRVDGTFDFWYPRGIWHDWVTGERGQKPLEQMHFFVHERLRYRPTGVTKENFVQALIELGWTEYDATLAWKERERDESRKNQEQSASQRGI